ncbi:MULTISPECIES: AvrD family protein [unclassified Streptomyces]|uniref:AvrD family protein n=1 Tax=unclassified Streptomyces TaxID=2593676 RepID=UPI001CBB20CB|nr:MULTISPECIES: AvrD family protein [unclassified Streptomyces]WPO73329.1 AvrD family protein [Streptomyces sp. KN37]
MQSTATSDILRISSADDELGSREGRFFGEGFKRVTQALTDITIRDATHEAPGRIDATAAIGIPGTWSRKGDTHQRPHLSTIDAMVLAAQLTGLYAAHVFELPPTGPFLIRSLAIKAGGTPDEENLGSFAVRAVHHSTNDIAALRRRLTAMDCTIGSMTVRVVVEHAATAPTSRTEGFYARPEDLPGPWNDAPYGASHLGRHQFLTGIEADVEAHTASAELSITTDPGGTRRAALPATMIDLFTSALQLGQILLYRLDGLDRATSNTLWMRSTTITPAPGAGSDDGRFHAELVRTNKLPTPQGVWRTGQIVATAAGMRLTCNVAHLLP